MISRKITSLAVLGLLSAASFTVQAANIDTFNFNNAQSGFSYANYAFPETPADLPKNDVQTTPEAVGNVREVGITTSNNVGVTIDAGVSASDRLSVSNNNAVNSTTYVMWDQGGIGLGGLDLTDGNTSDALLISITAIDQGNTTLKFDITDTLLNTTSMTLNNLGIGIHKFLFSSFSDPNSAAIFADVNAIKLTITSTVGSDLELDWVETNSFTVPEPATLTLLGAGLIGFGTLRKKRNG
jgi:hypothetical protein